MLKFWLNRLGYKKVIHPILIAAFLNLTQLLQKQPNYSGEKFKLNLSSDDKRLSHVLVSKIP